MLPLGVATPPSWVMPGAKYDYDFANNRYWGPQIWFGQNTLAKNYSPSAIFYNGSSATANTLFTQWRDGIVRPMTTQQNLRVSDYGLWSEGGAGLAHNYVLQCRDFTQTWTLTTLTAAKDQVGIDGKPNSASSLLATGVTDTAVQTLSFTSKNVTLSAWIKRITGVGTVSLSLDGVSWVDKSSLINSSTYTQVRLVSAVTTNPVVGIQLGTNGDKIAIDFFQVEDDDQATSPILTTSATNLRGAEYPTFGSPNATNDAGLTIINDVDFNTPFTFLVGYSGNFSTTLAHGLLVSGGGTNSFKISGAAGGGVVTGQNNAVNTATANSDVSGLFTLNKVCYGSDGGGSAICLNGGAVATGAKAIRTSASATSHWALGNNGSNILPTNGYLSRFTIWKKLLTSGEFVQYSTVTNNS